MLVPLWMMYGQNEHSFIQMVKWEMLVPLSYSTGCAVLYLSFSLHELFPVELKSLIEVRLIHYDGSSSMH